MKITVIGGGNIGTLMAAEAAMKGHEVTVFTSEPEKWRHDIDVFDSDNRKMFSGHIKNITNSVEDSLKDAEHIWITYPANMFSLLEEKIHSYVKKGQFIGVIPGSGGAEFAFDSLIKKGCILYGLQRVHSIARLKEYGNSVYSLGRKKSLQLGAIPSDKSAEISEIIEKIFKIPCKALQNYLSVTLTPSNPILHTARLYSMFKNYENGVFYPENILFYENWDMESSEMLLKCDKELQKLCSVIPLDLSAVIPLSTYYGCETAETMTEKIKSIKAFKGLTSPMKRTEYGWIPDFSSRYFTADFSYGLKIIKDLAGQFEIDVPNIDEIWLWYERMPKPAGEKYFSLEFKKDEIRELYI